MQMIDYEYYGDEIINVDYTSLQGCLQSYDENSIRTQSVSRFFVVVVVVVVIDVVFVVVDS